MLKRMKNDNAKKDEKLKIEIFLLLSFMIHWCISFLCHKSGETSSTYNLLLVQTSGSGLFLLALQVAVVSGRLCSNEE